jgi:protein-disulfide isomerase
MPTKKSPTKKTVRKNTGPASYEEETMESEEKLSPEAIRRLNSMYSNPNKPPYLLLLLIVALALFSAYLFSQVQSLKQSAANGGGTGGNNQAAVPTRPAELKIKKPDSKDHWRGNKNARYVWVEYSDLECPFCKRIHPDLVKLMDENKDNVAWVFRHYPLPFHPKAQPSAEAVECATEQGGDEAFWKLNDAIYEKMPDIEVSAYPDLANELGLDGSALQQCIDAKKYENKIKDQQTEGTNAGVQATPTSVIYDMKTGKTKLIEGAVPYDSLKTELANFIAANK